VRTCISEFWAFYDWKSKCGGMDVSVAQRLKAIEDEDRRLKLPAAGSLAKVTPQLGWKERLIRVGRSPVQTRPEPPG